MDTAAFRGRSPGSSSLIFLPWLFPNGRPPEHNRSLCLTLLRYLVGVLEPETVKGRVFEIGGPDVLTYAEMMRRVARLHHHRPLPMLAVPLLTPRLSSYWLSLVTDVNTAAARNLVDSMSNEVVVTDHSIDEIIPGTPMSYDDAVREAFRQRAAARAKS